MFLLIPSSRDIMVLVPLKFELLIIFLLFFSKDINQTIYPGTQCRGITTCSTKECLQAFGVVNGVMYDYSEH